MVKAANWHDKRNYEEFQGNFTKIYKIMATENPSKIPILF